MTSRIGQPDTEADRQLRNCLDSASLRSFVMVAGAGSGKTTSLVKALDHILRRRGPELKRRAQKVACITYTEVAENEIRGDMANSPLCHVSTIHSFLWEIIKPFKNDIRDWVASRLDEKIADRQETLVRPRIRQTTRDAATKDIERYVAQRAVVSGIARFTYGIGSDYSKGVLGHDDILRMVPALVRKSDLLKTLVAQRFPFVFVDESQDTNAAVVEALKAIDAKMTGRFCLGFFGDPMQRIYTTGSGAISQEPGWQGITKPENFRCPLRVLSVINKIREAGDGLVQVGGRTEQRDGVSSPVQGTARVFVVPADQSRNERLVAVRKWLVDRDKDPGWTSDETKDGVRLLVIVHRMAARRLGFADLYAAMNDKAPSSFKDGFLDGTSWIVRPFLSYILPLVSAVREKRQFEVMNLLRAQCPLLAKDKMGGDTQEVLGRLKASLEQLEVLLAADGTASIFDVLRFVRDGNLMIFDDRLLSRLGGESANATDDGMELSDEEEGSSEDRAATAYFACQANQLWGYQTYIEDESPFATQQGIKGAEFLRVLVMVDDEEGPHIQFSYNKYFGLVPMSDTDRDHKLAGEETVLDRTRRLFYVCCSRALRDLAVVVFARDVAGTMEKIKALAAFPADEIYDCTEWC